MKEINYTFSIGSNCDSTFFIRHNDLCKFAGPLDWVYIDFESALLNMEEGFERFTKDLFYYEPEADYRSMDDDELRRGKLTCHVAFDEATAILAGDALQPLAYSLVSECQNIDDSLKVKILKKLSFACGWNAMVEGQMKDISIKEDE